MENIKGIIFDYGGTIDSFGHHWSHIIEEGYRTAGIILDNGLFRDAYVHAERALAKERIILPTDNFLMLMRKKVRIELQWLQDNGHITAETASGNACETIARYCYDYAARSVNAARPVLEKLSARYPMMLVSNFYGNVEEVLRDFNLRQFFKGIIESAVVGVRKPDPAIFMLGVVALGLKPDEVLVVGDSLRKDIRPARSIGCHTAWIKGRGWTSDEDAATDPAQISGLSALLEMLQA
ncbi:MAG: HAD family hydrolase [Muribaculaceae bacterium]|nr:HAD family hydrolase [Muribaculaceae bacterium]